MHAMSLAPHFVLRFTKYGAFSVNSSVLSYRKATLIS